MISKAASYSPTFHCSTIGVSGLNFSVRNVKRWNPATITTIILDRHDVEAYNIIMWRNKERESEAEDVGTASRSIIVNNQRLSFTVFIPTFTIYTLSFVSGMSIV